MLARFQKKGHKPPWHSQIRHGDQSTLSTGPAPTPATITKNRSKKVKFSFRLAQTHNQSILREI